MTLAKVWAEKLSSETRPSGSSRRPPERLTSPRRSSRILQRDDLDERNRVIDDHGVLWDIIGIIKNDRQFLTLQVGHLAS